VGTIVSGVVERLTPAAVVVSVNGFSKGSILNEHLADYHGIFFSVICEIF
jgi:rRNA biogenesis protein RRP5